MNTLLVAGDALDDALEEAEKPKDSTEDYLANRFQKNVSGTVFQRAVLEFNLKSLIEEQTGINKQGWKKRPSCLFIY